MDQPNKKYNNNDINNPVLRSSNNSSKFPVRLNYFSPNLTETFHSEKLITHDQTIQNDKDKLLFKQQQNYLLRIPTEPNLNARYRSGSREANKTIEIGSHSPNNMPNLKFSFSNNPNQVTQQNHKNEKSVENKKILKADTSRDNLRKYNETGNIKINYQYVLPSEFRNEEIKSKQKIKIMITQPSDQTISKIKAISRPPLPLSPRDKISKIQSHQNNTENHNKNNSLTENSHVNVRFIFNPQRNQVNRKPQTPTTPSNNNNYHINQFNPSKIFIHNQFKQQPKLNQNQSNISSGSKQKIRIPQSSSRVELSPRNHIISQNLNTNPIPIYHLEQRSPIANVKHFNIQINSNSNKPQKKGMKLQFRNDRVMPQTRKLCKDDFAIGKKLGKGKFGDVYVVKHKITGFVCALKIIPKKIIKQQKIQTQFARQIKILFYLNHQNITKLYNYFDDNQNVYLLLQLCSQGPLYHLLKQKRRLSQQQASYMMKQICQGVQYMHSQRIIHRDLKPQNIIMQYGVPKLCDFGWAVYLGAGTRHTFCGTPLYVSPEILKGEWYDQKIDLWSLGILCYQLLIGRIPFKINTQNDLIKIVNQEIKFPEYIPISLTTKDFIMSILKKNPEDRTDIIQLLNHEFLKEKKVQTQEIDEFKNFLL